MDLKLDFLDFQSFNYSFNIMKKCPLTGKFCSNAKTISITEVAKDGTWQSLNVCENCENCELKDVKFLEKPKNMNNPLEKFFIAFAEEFSKSIKKSRENSLSKSACPICEYTLLDIKKVGRLGCSVCYEHFRKELEPVLMVSHGSLVHVGKIPKFKGMLDNENISKENKIKFLKEELKIAVEKEDYERAKIIKDQIDVLD